MNDFLESAAVGAWEREECGVLFRWEGVRPGYANLEQNGAWTSPRSSNAIRRLEPLLFASPDTHRTRMTPKLEFYDISYTGSKLPWSPFTARTYFALNVLDVSYERHLVAMMDIKPTLAGFGIPPPTDGSKYSLPVLAVTERASAQQGERRYITDSADIAEYLQTLFVDTLHGDESKSLYPPLSEEVRRAQGVQNARELARKAHKALVRATNDDERWLSITAPIHHILEPASEQYFLETRAHDWGADMDTIKQRARQQQDKVGGINKLFEHAVQPFADLYAHTDTSFLAGDQAIYADIIVLAALQWFRCSNESATFHALKAVDNGRLHRLWTDSQHLFRD